MNIASIEVIIRPVKCPLKKTDCKKCKFFDGIDYDLQIVKCDYACEKSGKEQTK